MESDIGNIRNKLILGIAIVSVLLIICIGIDYADDYDDVIVANNMTQDNLTGNVTYIDGVYYSLPKNSGVAVSDGKIYTEKPKRPIIAMTGKPSCTRCARNGCAYTWRTKKYINYCPNCKHYNCLGNKHKWQSRHEQEITCFRCDSDFCVNCGKEKYSWSRKNLIKA